MPIDPISAKIDTLRVNKKIDMFGSPDAQPKPSEAPELPNQRGRLSWFSLICSFVFQGVAAIPALTLIQMLWPRPWIIVTFVCASLRMFAQSSCDKTPAYTPCEFVFELTASEAAAHPNPYTGIEFEAEIRSPHFRTFLMPAFWDGGNKLIL